MKPISTISMFIAVLTMVFTTAAYADNSIKVTDENFVHAETAFYFNDQVKTAGGVNKWDHKRHYVAIDNQEVIRMNRDGLYSKMVLDVSKGATVVLPKRKDSLYQTIQIINEEHYTLEVMYPGETKELHATQMGSDYVYLVLRTVVADELENGMELAYAKQRAVKVTANSAKPYVPFNYDNDSRLAKRRELITQISTVTQPWKMFGTKDIIDEKTFRIGAAAGWGGLPTTHAAYIVWIKAKGAAAKGKPSQMTIPKPPLQFEHGAFYSFTAYDSIGWIATKNFTINNRRMVMNKDGSVTIRFNQPGAENNVDVVEDWTLAIRLYMPESLPRIVEYYKEVAQAGGIIAVADLINNSAE